MLAASTLVIEVIQCPIDRAEAPSIQIASVNESAPLFHQAKASTAKIEDGFYKLVVSAPVGNVALRLRSKHCNAELQIGTMADRTRTLSVALAPSVIVLRSIRNALMGTMPVSPDVAYLVSAAGNRRVIDIQDGAYYLERVLPGKYRLLMELNGGFQADIPMDLTGTDSFSAIRRDLDIRMIREHLGGILLDGHTLEKCLWCY